MEVIYIATCVAKRKERSVMVATAGVRLKIECRLISAHGRRLKSQDRGDDTVAGIQSGPRLVKLVERKIRFTLVGFSKDKSAEYVINAILI
jgi:hypothetical protein